MPVLVHLADEKEAERIRKNGIKPGKDSRGVFFMPVLPAFYVSHQWLRELKRNGAKTYVGIYFKLNINELVYAGKYNQAHRHIPLGEAIKEIMEMEDPLGYELIIDRKVEAKEITRIKTLPQNVGWRYFPASHSKKPLCDCPVCISPGTIKSKRLRNKIASPDIEMTFDQLLVALQNEQDDDAIEDLLWTVRNSRRKADPNELVFLLQRRSVSVNQYLALALRAFKHKNSKQILFGLLSESDDDTREFAADSLLELYGRQIEKQLIEMNDNSVNKAINDWKSAKPFI